MAESCDRIIALTMDERAQADVVAASEVFSVAAQAMRRILVEHARRKNQKRGGGVQRVSLDDAVEVGGGQSRDLVALDEAMNMLALVDARKSRVVEMRFFGGLSIEETAEVLEVSPITVKREWRAARAW